MYFRHYILACILIAIFITSRGFSQPLPGKSSFFADDIETYIYTADSSLYHPGFYPLYQDSAQDVFENQLKNTINFHDQGGKILNTNIFQKKKTRKKYITLNPLVSLKYSPALSEERTTRFYIGARTEGRYKNFYFRSDFYGSRLKVSGYNAFVADSMGIIPRIGKVTRLTQKRYRAFGLNGHIAYNPGPHFNFRLGNGNHFYGNGIHSLLLSSNSSSYPYFSMNMEAWKLKYEYILASLSDISFRDTPSSLQKKFGVFHKLSWNITPKINIQFFESVIWNSRDSVGYRGIEANYLNPVIFLRPVEYSQGSPDNVLLGFDLSVHAFKNTIIYGQFVLDEFNLSYYKLNETWWGKKYGAQFGIKQFNPLHINNAKAQIECNIVRPFNYSHKNTLINYGNMYSSLAHPLGANFADVTGLFSIRHNRWRFKAKGKYAIKGLDIQTDTITSFGGDIYKSYAKRNADRGIQLFNGNKTTFLNTTLDIEYLINPEMGMAVFTSFNFQLLESKAYSKNSYSFISGIKMYLHQHRHSSLLKKFSFQ